MIDLYHTQTTHMSDNDAIIMLVVLELKSMADKNARWDIQNAHTFNTKLLRYGCGRYEYEQD
jgi:hypothetical protein